MLTLQERQALLTRIRREFRLEWTGIHGAPHWARVRRNGLLLARMLDADTRVVELFAWLHDSQRRHDGADRDHGRRAVDFAAKLRNDLFRLSATDFELLAFALEHHSGGQTVADVTVMCCWDADRLDLGRVGIRPDPRLLCTDLAKTPAVLSAAYAASVRQYDRMLFGR